MSYISNILNKWGINITEDVYFAEFLKDHYPHNFFYIDQCPFKVGKKHAQIDVFYQLVLDRQISKSEFLNIEMKYRNVITKLWLYNNVYVESNLKDLQLRNKRKKIDKPFVKQLPLLTNHFDHNEFIEVTEKSDLELLIQLGIRDIAYVMFYFADYDLIIIPSWSCFIIYFNNCDKIDVVNKIITTEGLYLRSSLQ